MSVNVLDRLKSGEQALVLTFLPLEVLNTLLVGERNGRITADRQKHFLTRFAYCTRLRVTGASRRTGQIICRDHRLTPYDALYVESGCPLATLGSTAKAGRRQATSAFTAYDSAQRRITG